MTIIYLILLFNIQSYANLVKKNAPAIRIFEAPYIDGSLTEEVWSELPVLIDFVQYNPYNGEQPSQKTEVRIGYDDRAIYIGAMCYDRSPEEIKKEIQHPGPTPAGNERGHVCGSHQPIR